MTLEATVRARLRPTVHHWRKRLDNPEVKQARLLARRLRSGPLDVLHFGASESQYVAPYDVDQRSLPVMLADALSPELATYSVNNPGYHPKLFMSYLNILETYPVRPTVVLGLAVRFGFSAWSLHPEYGYERSLRALRRIKPDSAPWRFHAPVRLTRESDFVTHDEIIYPTVSGTRTIGEFRRQLKDSSASRMPDEERIRQLFAFHQGSLMEPAFLEEVTALGELLRSMKLAVVVYQLPIPVGRAAQVLGPDLQDRILDNLQTLNSRFIAGYGPIDILETGHLLESDEFINHDDAIEHINQLGRKRMVKMIADRVAQVRDKSHRAGI